MKVILLFFFLLSLSSLSVLASDRDEMWRGLLLPPPGYYDNILMNDYMCKWVPSYPNISCSDVPYPESAVLYTKSDVFIQTMWHPTVILKFISALFKSIPIPVCFNIF